MPATMVTLGHQVRQVLCPLRLLCLLLAAAFSADEVNFAGLAAAGATLLSPFPGEGRPGVKVGLRARAAQ